MGAAGQPDRRHLAHHRVVSDSRQPLGLTQALHQTSGGGLKMVRTTPSAYLMDGTTAMDCTVSS